MARRGRKIDDFIEIWCLVASRGLDLSFINQFSKVDCGLLEQAYKSRTICFYLLVVRLNPNVTREVIRYENFVVIIPVLIK
jgi:hypothetical protein